VNGFLVILSSPSGAGKTTIARRLMATRTDVAFSVSATTRPPRGNEREGVDYTFLSRDEFLARRDRGEFLEWAEYGDHLYATVRSSVDGLLAQGRHVILDIEVQGARQVREQRVDAVAIFVLPPSGAALRSRLRGRGSEEPAALAKRLTQADGELEQAATYDYVVVNENLDEAVAAVGAIIEAETRRTARRPGLRQDIEALRRDLALSEPEKER